MLLVNTGQDHAPDALIVFVVRCSERFAAVNRDLVPAISKLRADFFGELLKATVAIRDAARANDGNLQDRSPIGEAGRSAGMLD